MTPKDFERAMRDICRNTGDPEALHGDADDLMCELLRNLGYGKGIDVFEAASKWYA